MKCFRGRRQLAPERTSPLGVSLQSLPDPGIAMVEIGPELQRARAVREGGLVDDEDRQGDGNSLRMVPPRAILSRIAAAGCCITSAANSPDSARGCSHG